MQSDMHKDAGGHEGAPRAAGQPKPARANGLTLADLAVFADQAWRQRRLFALVTGSLLGLTLLWLLLTPNSYKATSLVELSFAKEQSSKANETKVVASVDASGLVASAAMNIGSRAVAGEVVSRLKLDQAGSSRRGILSSILSGVYNLFGLQRFAPSDHEIAVDRLLRNLRVEHKSNLYVISINYADRSPEAAARIANAFGLEHLRSERLKELRKLRSSIAREIVTFTETVGARHPGLIDAKARLQHIDDVIAATNAAEATREALPSADQQFTPAVPVAAVSSPNRALLGFVGLLASLMAGLAAVWIKEGMAFSAPAGREHVNFMVLKDEIASSSLGRAVAALPDSPLGVRLKPAWETTKRRFNNLTNG